MDIKQVALEPFLSILKEYFSAPVYNPLIGVPDAFNYGLEAVYFVSLGLVETSYYDYKCIWLGWEGLYLEGLSVVEVHHLFWEGRKIKVDLLNLVGLRVNHKKPIIPVPCHFS